MDVMSEPFGWSISTSPLGEELLVEGLLVEELQGSTRNMTFVFPPCTFRRKHHRSVRDQPVCRRRDCCADGRDFSSWHATPA